MLNLVERSNAVSWQSFEQTNERSSFSDLNRDSQSDVQIEMHGLDLTSNEWEHRVSNQSGWKVFSLLNYSWDENSILQLAKPSA